MGQDNIANEKDINYFDNNLCVICNKEKKDYSESEYSMMCYSCRQKHKRMNIPLKIKLFLITLFVFSIFSIINLQPVLSIYETYLKAEDNMKAKEYSLAYHNYYNILEKYNDSLNLIFKTADAALASQYFDELAQLLDNHLVGKDLNDSQYAKALEYSDLLNSYYETLNEISEVDKSLSHENLENYSENFVSKLEELLQNKNLDKTILYLYLGNASLNDNDALNYLKLATENDYRFTYPYSFYGNALRRAGKLDEAKNIYRKALEKNATDALSIRGLSIIQLLEGQKSLSLESIMYAYDLEPNGLYIVDSLVIALCENGLTDEAMSLIDTLFTNGVEVESDLREYLNGNINIYKYYIEESD